MAVATFVENEYDTPTAKALVYDATWFEVLMLWLVVLFAINIKTYRLTRRKKWPILMFHIAFILMFLGGAITRYVGFEGQMPIKEGQVTNEIISDLTYFKLAVSDGNKTRLYDKNPYRMSFLNTKEAPWPFKNTFEQNYHFDDKIISLKTIDYIPLAKDSLHKTDTGEKMLHLVTVGDSGRDDIYISEGDIKDIGGTLFSFNNPLHGSVKFIEKAGAVTVSLPESGAYLMMEGQQKGIVNDVELLPQQSGTIQANVPMPLNHKTLYSINNTHFVIPERTFKGKITYFRGDKDNSVDKNLLTVVQVALRSGNDLDTLFIHGGKGVTDLSTSTRINGMDVSLGFGSKILKTDFYLRCDDFLLARYPGSNNPSSYVSRITVIDEKIEKQHHIYMNNVMDYRGYRFFQASYFPDESGTILSVNADRWGTTITYWGYFLLFAGMFFTLFWQGTHFWKLNSSLKKMHNKNLLTFFFLMLMGIGPLDTVAQNNHEFKKDKTTLAQQKPGPNAQFIMPKELRESRVIDRAHAERFSRLLVQDFQGRIKPMNTHTLELLRKLYKKDVFTHEGIAITADQWFISMQIDPGFWADTPIIKVDKNGGDKLRAETGANPAGYTSYAKLVDSKTGVFVLGEQAAKSFNKRKAEQSNYDKAVIKLAERFNIFSNVAFGYYTRVVPIKNDPDQTWRSWIYSSESSQVEIDQPAYALITPYLNGVKEGLKTGNWTLADQELAAIIKFQKTWGAKIIPPDSKISIEIFYNQVNPFFWLMVAYSVLGTWMVFLGFVEVFSSKSKYKGFFQVNIKIVLAIMVFALVLQVVALGIRWYLSGHAPWSNGYEAIVFISAVGVLSGLLLYRNRNAFIPAAGALVAVIMMGFAHGGSMLDPQITPLEPVLKSYWLMVHVGIITSSYAFFGLSAVLSVISLILYSTSSSKKITHAIKELTLVNEIALTIGVFALTIGTFLGGIWANESWGRYWSWDPKETWAFISVIVYAVVLHLRLVPKLKGKLIFNISSLWAIWSIVFTYFGVNYYLSGLHSYAAGDPVPVPLWIYITVLGMVILSVVAYKRNIRFKKQ